MKSSMKIQFREPAVIALETMRAHKLRSFLMLLGIILSVMTLILVVSLVNGVNVYFADKVANMGANVFHVNRFGIINNEEDWVKAQRTNRRITWEDYELMRDNLQLPKEVAALVRTRGKARAGRQSLEDVEVQGMTGNYALMATEEVANGRWVTDSDDEHRAGVAMIGFDVADKLFGGQDPLDKTLTIDGHEFTVVGVGKRVGTAFGQSQDNYVYIPIHTFLKNYGESTQSLGIVVQTRSQEWIPRAEEEARVLMRASRHLSPNDKDTFGIVGADSLMSLWKNLTGTLATGMVGLVSVFMLIGGIVVMNVMLASVTERTREIGIRKSLGARKTDITLQIMIESIVMSGMGGLAGLIIAWGFAFLIGHFTPVPMSVPIYAVMIAIGVSTAVGMFFGIYPARKAASLDPIEALRFEA
jgi:putative ABC transport system permease protein